MKRIGEWVLALMVLMVARAVPLALWYPRILRSLGRFPGEPSAVAE